MYYFINNLRFKNYNFTEIYGLPIIISDNELEEYTVRGILFNTILPKLEIKDCDKLDISFDIIHESEVLYFDINSIDYIIRKNKHSGKWYIESAENVPDDILANIFSKRNSKIYLYNFNIEGSVKDIHNKILQCLERHIYIDERSEVVSYSNSIDDIMECWKFINDPDNILILNNPSFKDIIKLMGILKDRVDYNQIYVYDDERDDIYLLEYHNFIGDNMRTIIFERVS